MTLPGHIPRRVAKLARCRDSINPARHARRSWRTFPPTAAARPILPITGEVGATPYARPACHPRLDAGLVTVTRLRGQDPRPVRADPRAFIAIHFPPSRWGGDSFADRRRNRHGASPSAPCATAPDRSFPYTVLIVSTLESTLRSRRRSGGTLPSSTPAFHKRPVAACLPRQGGRSTRSSPTSPSSRPYAHGLQVAAPARAHRPQMDTDLRITSILCRPSWPGRPPPAWTDFRRPEAPASAFTSAHPHIRVPSTRSATHRAGFKMIRSIVARTAADRRGIARSIASVARARRKPSPSSRATAPRSDKLPRQGGIVYFGASSDPPPPTGCSTLEMAPTAFRLAAVMEATRSSSRCQHSPALQSPLPQALLEPRAAPLGVLTPARRLRGKSEHRGREPG